jgi:hypothetical protein
MEETMSEHELGRYTGKLILEPTNSSQQMRTVLEFGFLDTDGKHWLVPRGTSVDGASIPKALWSLLANLWEGKYRDAIVMHDHHCAVRDMDWRSVHRMFYRALLVSGVPVSGAKLVYAGVYFAGPRWPNGVDGSSQSGRPIAPPQTAPANILYALCRDSIALAVSEAMECNGKSAFDWITSGHHHPRDISREITLRLNKLSDMIEEEDPSLGHLEAAIDYAVTLIPRFEGYAPRLSVGQLALQD